MRYNQFQKCNTPRKKVLLFPIGYRYMYSDREQWLYHEAARNQTLIGLYHSIAIVSVALIERDLPLHVRTGVYTPVTPDPKH